MGPVSSRVTFWGREGRSTAVRSFLDSSRWQVPPWRMLAFGLATSAKYRTHLLIKLINHVSLTYKKHGLNFMKGRGYIGILFIINQP